MEKVKGQLREKRSERRFQTRLLIGLSVLACLTPLGVLLPRMFDAGEAWGEWGPAYLEKALGYVPEGLMRTIHIWKAPLPDYAFSAEGSSIQSQLFSYVISGFAGLLVVVSIIIVVSAIVRKHER